MDARIELIRELIPLGLAEVGRMLDEEVARLAGPRHGRKEALGVAYRHGSNPGSVRLGGQRLPVRVPRVRDEAGEVRLSSYAQLHGGAGEVDDGLFRKVLLGISCRDYEAAVEAVPGAIGLSKSMVSRAFQAATRTKLRAFQERDLSGLDVVALFLDGKTFADDTIVLALGVTLAGEKHFLGFVQTATENERALTGFLRSLVDRVGLVGRRPGGDRWREGPASGREEDVGQPGADPALPVAQTRERGRAPAPHGAEALAPKAPERLPEADVQGGCARPEDDPPRARGLEPVGGGQSGRGLRRDAHAAPARALPLLGRSLKTTNVLESVNAQAEQRCGRVDHWKTPTRSSAGSLPRCSTSNRDSAA